MAWSSCSEVALQQNLNLGIGNCLYNVPHASRIVGGQQCGNDIVEQGEQCDCGYPEQCKRCTECCKNDIGKQCKALDLHKSFCFS